MEESTLESDILRNFGGINRDNLNELLSNPEDLDNAISIASDSPYIRLGNLANYLKSNSHNFSVLDLNIQCINAKFDEFKSLIDDLACHDFTFSAICLQETWLERNASDFSLFEMENYTSVPLGATCSSHGGLMIYLHNSFQFTLRNFYSPNKRWEGQFIDIFGNGLKKTITLCNIYRPPRDRNDDIQGFIDDLNPIIDTLSRETSDKIILGDFNIDLLNVTTRQKYADYLDLMLNNNLNPKITLPTRLSERRATLIDHIFCSLSHGTTSCLSGIIFTELSDHFPCFTCIDQKIDKQDSPKFIKIVTKDSNSVQKFYDEINNTDLMESLEADLSQDPNINYEKLENILCRAKEKHLPVKTKKFNKYKHKRSPWITQGILRSIKYRDNLYKNLKCTLLDEPDYNTIKQNLKVYNKILKTNISQLKQTYYYSQFHKFKNDIRKTWDTIKFVLNMNRNKTNFPQFFLINNNKINNKYEIATHFNKFFTNIGPQLASKIHTSNLPPFTSYLTDHIEHTFSFEQVHEADITSILIKFKPKSSVGHDELSMKLMKGIIPSLSKPLALIINQSLVTGIFPNKLKLAKVQPLFKKGDTTLLDNYRPISILPSLSKVFEKVVYKQLYDYFVSNHLFYTSQHGFKTLHSTETAALEFIDKIFKFLDSGKLPLSIYLDLSKAFDTLNHDILFHKLNYYGIGGTPLKWFKSYLTNRYQYVMFNEACSSSLSLKTGVPQGSILGPLLFIIYTNDMYRASSKFGSILYADDTTLINPLCTFNTSINSNNTGSTLSENINSELKNVHDWLAVNKLSLNIVKTKYMIFHFPQRKIDLTLDLKIDNIPISKTSEFNFLGLVIHDNLNWRPHMNKIGNKLSKLIGIFKRLHKYLPTNTLLLMYNSLFLPHLNYSILAWGYSCDRIFKLQKSAIRLICHAKYNSHTDPLFKSLNILKVHDLLKLKALKFYFKYTQNQLPLYFNKFYDITPVTHSYHTRHKHLLQYPIPKRNRSANCIRYFIPSLLKNTPPCIKDKLYTHCLSGFSKYAKSQMIRQYSEACIIINCYICSD